MFDRLKISTRLAIGFGFVFLLLCALTIFAINRMHYLADNTSDIYNHPLTVSNAVLRINTNIVKIHHIVHDVVLSPGNDNIDRESKLVDDLEGQVYADFDLIGKWFLGDKALFDEARSAFVDWESFHARVISLKSKGKQAQAVAMTKGKGTRQLIQIENAMEALSVFAQGKAIEFRKSAEKTTQRSLKIMYLLLFLVMVVVVTFTVYMTKSITRPLKVLQDVASEIGKGKLDTRIDLNASSELMALAGSLSDMVLNLSLVTASRDELNKEIIERKKIEEELRESSIFLKESQKIANLGTYIFEVKDGFWRSSDILDEIFGIDESYKRDVEGWLNIVCPDSREEMASYLSDEVIGKRGSFDKEYCIIRKGKKREVHGLGELEFDENGEVLRMIGTIQDITERKRMEEEMLKSEKIESLGVLAGGIAHDFNNLLATILGNVSYAKGLSEADDEVYKSMEESEKAILRARDLTRQLLSFSRGGTPVKKVLRVGELLKEAARFGIMGSNVELELVISTDLKAVEIDEGQLSQVVHNMVINAVHAMPGGGVVEVKADNIMLMGTDILPLDSGEYIRISIKDNGSGISRENLTKIFDPFFTTKQMGSGLGLATAYTIIKNHLGHIEISSEVGEGTTFDIYLPVSVDRPLEESGNKDATLSGEGRILVMDDEKSIRDLVCKILKRLGYVAEGVCDGSKAVEAYRSAMKRGSGFDTVILDLTIPGGMGGKEVVVALLEIDPNARVIASSGYSEDLVMSDYKKYGFKDVIEKPYSMATLSQVVYKVLEG